EIKLSGSAPRTQFVGYERTEVLTAILAYVELGDGTFQAKLEQSPFYPEGGGQVSDAGYIENEETGARADLIKATRLDDDQVLTFSGEGFGEGLRVRAVVPWSVRFPTMANHTATHLLHKALRDLLGDHVKQAGSAVRPDKLRFDFTHPQALTAEERERVEHAVNEILHERSREAEQLRSELAETRKQSKKAPKTAAGPDMTIVDKAGNVVFVQAKAVKGGPLRDLSDRVRKQEKADGVIVASVDDGH